MKKLLLSLFILSSMMCSAEHLARVQSISGVLVFSKCTPVHDYTTLGTVSLSVGKQSAGYISMNGVMIPISDDPQYTEIRNGLVAQAVLANRETEGIIINGKSATMIKFDSSLSRDERTLARPELRYGVRLFVDSEPIDEYRFVNTKKIMMANDYIDGVINKLIKKFSNKDNIDGIIVHYVTGGSDNADGIRFVSK